MTLKQFLAEDRLRRHRTTTKEIQDLLRVADRNLKDAAVEEISFDLSDYDRAGEISDDEASELPGEVKKFRGTVLDWLKAHHPKVVPK